jgi:hypothetical protein
MNKLLSSLLIVVSVSIIQMPISADVSAAGAQALSSDKKEKKDKRKTRLVGPSVGKKMGKAFEAYGLDAEDGSNVDNAINMLLEINAKKDYDKAYLDLFIGKLYAQKADETNSIKYLKKAVATDLLNESDQDEGIKLLADLQFQGKQYKNAISNYHAWMEFTGKSDAQIWMKVAQSNLQIKSFDNVVVAADNAIAALGDKKNKDPYTLKLNAYYERKMFKECIDVLETAVQIFPEVVLYWTQLGQFYAMVENFPKSLATLDLAYKLGYLTKSSQVVMVANLYAQSEMPFKAASILEKHIDSGLVKRDDKNIRTLANYLHASLDIGKAATYYGELAKMTNDAKHYSKQGMLLAQDEQFAKGIAALKKALDVGVKNSGRLYQSIAESYYYLENYKQANVYIQKAMKEPKSRRTAKGWAVYIKEAADRKNISI